ncbi:MAG: phosphohydrolase [Clostridia bacterium]|nr:phosphohydrolase [Clostridia bacterium]MBQ3051183.1 phosphohydrolase [Clostridia bacterium]MBQ3328084.1 phosphohydrolase [Clostridia bacterium]MBQ4459008.1 phosphohydrolase [Clostridia bacterium]MBQ6785940.1 phosphohydrolase [Clostridia bacterium]
MHNEELNKVRIALAEEKEAMEKYGAEGKPEEGLNTETGVSGGPMNTISGVLLDPKHVKADDIRLYDIAHPLSFICRGVGQVKHFLSVGQHCINCAKEAEGRGYSDRVILACLLHDGAEAYVSDIIRPVKVLLENFDEIEDRFQEAIYEHFGLGDLTAEERELVHLIDDAMLWNEAKELFAHVDELEPPLLSTIPNFKVRDFQDVENEFNLMAVNLLHRLGDSRL